MHGDVALVEVGDELRAQPGRPEARNADQQQRQSDDQSSALHGAVEQPRIAVAQPAHDAVLLLLDLAGHE